MTCTGGLSYEETGTFSSPVYVSYKHFWNFLRFVLHARSSLWGLEEPTEQWVCLWKGAEGSISSLQPNILLQTCHASVPCRVSPIQAPSRSAHWLPLPHNWAAVCHMSQELSFLSTTRNISRNVILNIPCSLLSCGQFICNAWSRDMIHGWCLGAIWDPVMDVIVIEL